MRFGTVQVRYFLCFDSVGVKIIVTAIMKKIKSCANAYKTRKIILRYYTLKYE